MLPPQVAESACATGKVTGKRFLCPQVPDVSKAYFLSSRRQALGVEQTGRGFTTGGATGFHDRPHLLGLLIEQRSRRHVVEHDLTPSSRRGDRLQGLEDRL